MAETRINRPGWRVKQFATPITMVHGVSSHEAIARDQLTKKALVEAGYAPE